MEVKMSNENAANNKDILPNLTLADVEVNGSCVITLCKLTGKVKTRFAEMGLVVGTEVTVLRVAPLGDPIVIRARGYELCLRKDTARQFSVTQGRTKQDELPSLRG